MKIVVFNRKTKQLDEVTSACTNGDVIQLNIMEGKQNQEDGMNYKKEIDWLINELRGIIQRNDELERMRIDINGK